MVMSIETVPSWATCICHTWRLAPRLHLLSGLVSSQPRLARESHWEQMRRSRDAGQICLLTVDRSHFSASLSFEFVPCIESTVFHLIKGSVLLW